MCRAPLGPSAQAAVSAAIEAETRERTLTEEQDVQKRLLEAGKRLHAAVDADLFEKDPTTYGQKAPKRVSNEKFIMAMGPYLKLLALDGYKGGISVQMMFELGGCDVFVGRRLDGKVCPPEEPPPPQPKQKKKKKSGTKKGEKGGMREIDLMI